MYSHCFPATLKTENVFVLQLLNSYNRFSPKWKSHTAQNCGLNGPDFHKRWSTNETLTTISFDFRIGTLIVTSNMGV